MQRKWLVQSNLQRMVGRCCGSMSMTCPMISLAFEDEVSLVAFGFQVKEENRRFDDGNVLTREPCSQSEAEQCIKRLQSHKGVKRVFIINNQGQTIRSSLNDPEEERRYAVLISELTKKTRSMVRELDPEVSRLLLM